MSNSYSFNFTDLDEVNVKNIIYNYIHCSLEELSKDLNFDENKFNEILENCFKDNKNVMGLDVLFTHYPSQATDKFECTINIDLKGKKLHIVERGEESFSKIAILACHKALKLIREEKEENVDR